MTQEQINKLQELKQLLDSGILNEEEYAKEKDVILNQIETNEKPSTEKKSSSSKKYLYALVCLAVIAVIGLAVYNFGDNTKGGTYETLKGLSIGVDKNTFAEQLQASGILKNKIEIVEDDMFFMDGILFDELHGKVGGFNAHFDNGILTKLTFEFLDESEYERNVNLIPIIKSYLEEKYSQKDEQTYYTGNLTIKLGRGQNMSDDYIDLEYSIK